MFGLIKKIFSQNESNNTEIEEIGIELSDKETNFIKEIENKIANEELRKSEIFNLKYSSILLKHISGEININNSNNYLTSDEKEKLKINKRLKISKELIEVFHQEKLANKNPKELLSNLVCKVRNTASLINSVKKYKNAGIRYVVLSNAGDERDCEWCKKNNNKKVDINNVLDLVNTNCECDYIRTVLLAKF